MKGWALLNNHKKWIMLPITNPFVFRAFVSKVELVSGNFFILERKKTVKSLVEKSSFELILCKSCKIFAKMPFHATSLKWNVECKIIKRLITDISNEWLKMHHECNFMANGQMIWGSSILPCDIALKFVNFPKTIPQNLQAVQNIYPKNSKF